MGSSKNISQRPSGLVLHILMVLLLRLWIVVFRLTWWLVFVGHARVTANAKAQIQRGNMLWGL